MVLPGIDTLPGHIPPPRLGNMSCNPRVAVVHPSDDPTRQLVPAVSLRLGAGDGRTIRSRRQLLRVLGGARWALYARDADAIRRLEAITRAVPELLDLPSVLPLAGRGNLPVVTERVEPLLAWTLLSQRSGPIWLRRRPCAVGIPLAADSTATLLVGPDLRDRILAAIDAPGWPARVLERARSIEEASQ